MWGEESRDHGNVTAENAAGQIPILALLSSFFFFLFPRSPTKWRTSVWNGELSPPQEQHLMEELKIMDVLQSSRSKGKVK